MTVCNEHLSLPQEQEAEKNDREAVAAWENLQKQRQKAQQVIQAAQVSFMLCTSRNIDLCHVVCTHFLSTCSESVHQSLCLHVWQALVQSLLHFETVGCSSKAVTDCCLP